MATRGKERLIGAVCMVAALGGFGVALVGVGEHWSEFTVVAPAFAGIVLGVFGVNKLFDSHPLPPREPLPPTRNGRR